MKKRKEEFDLAIASGGIRVWPSAVYDWTLVAQSPTVLMKEH
jgi:hypothetical protein